MELVALSLQKAAVERQAKADEFDQFGRSAFNRYYYATFLAVRALIVEFQPQWIARHSTIPDLLTGSIEREIKNYRASAVRRKDRDAIEICNKGIAALAALAEMMRVAYSVRVTADYNPDIKIASVQNERFSLGSTSINDAHGWLDQAKTYISAIRRAWSLARGRG